jgi:hypothetical protein
MTTTNADCICPFHLNVTQTTFKTRNKDLNMKHTVLAFMPCCLIPGLEGEVVKFNRRAMSQSILMITDLDGDDAVVAEGLKPLSEYAELVFVSHEPAQDHLYRVELINLVPSQGRVAASVADMVCMTCKKVQTDIVMMPRRLLTGTGSTLMFMSCCTNRRRDTFKSLINQRILTEGRKVLTNMSGGREVLADADGIFIPKGLMPIEEYGRVIVMKWKPFGAESDEGGDIIPFPEMSINSLSDDAPGDEFLNLADG